ncbi:MAG: efflux RND transporter periplasmic adaptor subunit [Blastocatellia bacterium]|nr:efflux RND transporter periplasmic adaptor subunit [Blastocatellia bacterium]
MRTTGTVQPNAYKETPVFPIAGGIVREVKAELGNRVRQAQVIAVVFSTELAEAQAEYLKMLAEQEEHHQHYKRTAELLEIGAVSREELEMVTARHKTAQAKTASARQQLILLGMTEGETDALRKSDQVRSLVTVPSPVSGTVISRSVNPGEVVEKGKELFRVVDLSNVWVIGQVYENDFRSVNVGTRARVTTPSYPGKTFTGRVSYIDPRVDPQTRTAQVRVEVANPGEALRLGMFVDVDFGAAAATAAPTAVTVPRDAIQMIGAKPVVFVSTGQPGVFVQREVITGPEADGLVPVYSGVSAGERVVTSGSFFLRAESMKLNPAQSLNASSGPMAGTLPDERGRSPQAPDAQPNDSGTQKEDFFPQSVKVLLTDEGYEPASIRLKLNTPARLTFVRQVEKTCGTELVIPEFGIKRDLPLNQPVVVEFTPKKKGEYTFACGMDMLRGKIIVQ